MNHTPFSQSDSFFYKDIN